MRNDSRLKFIFWFGALAASATANFSRAAEEAGSKSNQGLIATFTSVDKKNSEVTLAPNIWLYVPAGQSPAPFLPAGKFTATWTGFISADLRGDYNFQAALNGNFKLEINATVALETSGTNSISPLSQSIRLNKGTNFFRASFSSPATGDALVRLQWKPADSILQPIPLAVLSHAENLDLAQANKLRFGRELFVEHRCIKCHVGPALESAMPELAMDAPSFENLGARRQAAWTTRWIADPKSLRNVARMPKLLHGAKAKEDAEAIAAFLTAMASAETNMEFKATVEQANAGKKLFETFHCEACHNAPDATELDAKKIPLKSVGEKFFPASLITFLQQPDAHYAWIRMPRFRLNDEQRNFIAAYLLSSHADAPAKTMADVALVERGKKLVQSSGCLNCHSLKLENQFSGKPLANLKNFHAGCLAEKLEENSQAPDFSFTSDEREALQTFLATDRVSLTRHVPAEFAERQTRNLHCRNCHGEVEGIPPFEILGEKLRPEWMAKFIAGEILDKPRPWLDAQMPAFPKRAELLAQGIAMQHGFPPQTPADPPIEKTSSENGHRLISAPPLGFGCVQCHAVGATAALQVFEAPGINLGWAGARLQPAFFKRWVRNPPLVDPLTKMPVFFDGDKSPLTEIYEGNGEKQIDAMWNYLRLGEKMPAPKTLP